MFRRVRHHWQSFRPRKRRFFAQYKGRDRRHDRRLIQRPQYVEHPSNNSDFFDVAEQRVVGLLQRRPEVNNLDKRIPSLRDRFAATKHPLDGVAALLAQAPRAVLAQLQMDQYPRGYRNKEKRLYELIDFNDTLVDTILLMDDTLRRQFADRVKQSADRVCKRVGAPCFSDEQWRAIIRGLTREVAVYLAARENGFDAFITDRASDALGIDLQIRDPEDGRYINIDVKTPSSFRHRMEQLIREGRLTERQLLEGDRQSYIVEHNGRGNRRTQVVVLCILPDLFGDLADWRFVNADSMRLKLNQLIREHGLRDGRYGIYI
ncbi:MAG: hypothetical protein WBP12_00580 [Candidatus Saccharimonas sp.]